MVKSHHQDTPNIMKTLIAQFGWYKFPLDRGFKFVFYTLIFHMILHAGEFLCKCWSKKLSVLTIYNNFSDTLTLSDGISEAFPPLAKHCGGSIPSIYYSQTNMVFIHFLTDGSVTGTGFELEYTPSSKLCTIKISISCYSWIWVENTEFQLFEVSK